MNDFLKTITSDDYRRFINHFRAQVAVNGWDYNRVAEIMNAHPNTVRNWLALRTTMSGPDVLNCIKKILGGYIL